MVVRVDGQRESRESRQLGQLLAQPETEPLVNLGLGCPVDGLDVLHRLPKRGAVEEAADKSLADEPCELIAVPPGQLIGQVAPLGGEAQERTGQLG